MKRTCVQCGKEFELTDSEVDFYKRKNLHMPKRCQACRDKNKQQSGAPQIRQPSSAGSSLSAKSPSVSPQKRPAGGGSGKGMMAAVAGIMLLLAVFFCLKQTGILSDGKGSPSTVTALQTAAPSPEAATPASEPAADLQESPPTEASVTNPPQEEQTPSPEASVTNPPQEEQTPLPEASVTNPPQEEQTPSSETTVYTFRSEKLLLDHYKKHGIEMGFDSAEAYAEAANQVIHNPDVLHKLEAEDGDDVYYLEATNEFVVVSTDGYIRTYFNPDDGIDYYNRQ